MSRSYHGPPPRTVGTCEKFFTTITVVKNSFSGNSGIRPFSYKQSFTHSVFQCKKLKEAHLRNPSFLVLILQTHVLKSLFEWHCYFENSLNFLAESSKHLATGQTRACETREAICVTLPLERQMWPGEDAELLGRVHSWQLFAKEASSFLSSIRFRHIASSWCAPLSWQDGCSSVSINTFLHPFPCSTKAGLGNSSAGQSMLWVSPFTSLGSDSYLQKLGVLRHN